MDPDVLNGAAPPADAGDRESLILALTGTVLALTVAARAAAKFDLLSGEEVDELLNVSQMCAHRVAVLEGEAAVKSIKSKRGKR